MDIIWKLFFKGLYTVRGKFAPPPPKYSKVLKQTMPSFNDKWNPNDMQNIQTFPTLRNACYSKI